jgi:hypothetical protein
MVHWFWGIVRKESFPAPLLLVAQDSSPFHLSLRRTEGELDPNGRGFPEAHVFVIVLLVNFVYRLLRWKGN